LPKVAIVSPRNIHPPKMKLPSKVQASESPMESDEEEMNSPIIPTESSDESRQEMFQVNIEVKSPRSPRSPQKASEGKSR
jgi:hypothetical protein